VASFIFFQTASSIMWFIIMATHMAYNQRIFSSWLYLKIKRATPSHSRARVWSLHRRSQVVLHKPTSGKKGSKMLPGLLAKESAFEVYISIYTKNNKLFWKLFSLKSGPLYPSHRTDMSYIWRSW
jgi:hypothetical protein